jgi:FixJ family two-component response regulator
MDGAKKPQQMPRSGAGRDSFVFVVDDDPAVLSSLKFSLELEGFLVRAYARPAELLDAGDLLDAGCLVLDYNLPEMTGLDLLQQLRDRHVAAPAVLITSHPTRVLRDRAAAAGVPIVEKPLFGSALTDRVRDAFAHPGH